MTKEYKHRLSRRDFVKAVAASTGGIMTVLLGVPVIGYLVSPALRKEEHNDVIALGPLENYPIGIPTPFNFTRTSINGWEHTVTSVGMFVLRKEGEAVRVFSDTCTHLSCIVKWQPDIQEYLCPCHDGHFDIEGFVTKGPPPRPLDEFQTKIENGMLFINLPSFRRSA